MMHGKKPPKRRHIPWNHWNLEKYCDIHFWSYCPTLLTTHYTKPSMSNMSSMAVLLNHISVNARMEVVLHLHSCTRFMLASAHLFCYATSTPQPGWLRGTPGVYISHSQVWRYFHTSLSPPGYLLYVDISIQVFWRNPLLPKTVTNHSPTSTDCYICRYNLHRTNEGIPLMASDCHLLHPNTGLQTATKWSHFATKIWDSATKFYILSHMCNQWICHCFFFNTGSGREPKQIKFQSVTVFSSLKKIFSVLDFRLSAQSHSLCYTGHLFL